MDVEQLLYSFFTFLFLVLVLSYILLSKRRTKNLRPPGPRRLPIIGNLHLLNPNNPHRSLLSLSLKHGPLMLLQLGSTPTLVISSAAVAEQIFRNHDRAFSGRAPNPAGKRLFYNATSMVFAPYGDHWREARRVTVLELLSPRRIREFEPVRFDEVRKLVRAIKELAAVNVTELTLALANNVMCRVALGDWHGGGYGGAVGARLHGILAEAQRLLGGFWAADYFPAMGWVDRFVLGLRARLEKNFEELNKVYDKAIGEHMNSGEEGRRMREGHVDVLRSLLKLHELAAGSDDGGFLSSMDHVKGVLAEAFIAGTDTSSATITWTMTELMRNPRVMLKLQQELQQFPLNFIQESELEKLKYLKQVIKESLRLHPPAPLLVPRETIAPCAIHGYAVPAKTRVLINAAAISTDPNVWEEPLEFTPERFEGSQVDFRGQHFEFLPFGAGRRKCPGMNLALALVELAVANLVHCFDWSLPEGMKVEDISMDEAIGITVHKKEPLILVAKYKWGD